MTSLTATVTHWGTEAGFLGIEGHLEGRVQALVREASVRMFGNCDAERDRLVCRIETMEKELEDADRATEEIEEKRDTESRPLMMLQAWFTLRSKRKDERAAHKRLEPELRKAHLDLETAERARRDAAEWREMALQSLRATYAYCEERAALVRPKEEEKEKEKNHDTRDNRQFIVHRAN